MVTVRKLLDDLSHGRTNVERVKQDFMTRSWPAARRVTPAEAAGVVGIQLPEANSVDWVDMHHGLTEWQRQQLREAYDRANHPTNPNRT
jgi:hypothetical protein